MSGPETLPGVCPVARRALLLGAGAAGLTALLAACGGDGKPTGATPTGPAPTTEEVPAGPDLPDGALVAVEEVPVNGGVVVDDILVVQPKKGAFRAYDAVCPHQRILVNPPDSSGVIMCPGHLSHFRASDGSRLDGPAPRGLAKIDVKVSGEYVVRI